MTGIQTCNEEKDLGVIFDGSLQFDLHTHSAISKANRMIGILRRTFTYLDKDIFLQQYNALIRPLVEYGNAVWYSQFKPQSAAIERVQRRAIKIVGELKELNYREAKSLELTVIEKKKNKRRPVSVKTALNVIAFKNAIDKTKLIGKFSNYDDKNASGLLFNHGQ